ncbi:hypothetical protein EYF80_053139 [Liparis tanakae]|uniref:Uncharacterized protein n=1 Tax=Liparis tanakae TaxID=230148 RepID=A0A4Z2F7D1_9TELE|nr:hypothetical protein EYF80_053139 [Liparis tanakae]
MVNRMKFRNSEQFLMVQSFVSFLDRVPQYSPGDGQSGSFPSSSSFVPSTQNHSPPKKRRLVQTCGTQGEP